ncbi:UNVERIFIED_CONTAM: hypothetical protein Cloal_1014 [Acetivibrio alkalicellulosi]
MQNKNINIHTLEFSYYNIKEDEHKKLIKTLNQQEQKGAETIYYSGHSLIRGIRYRYIIINIHNFYTRILKVIINPSQFLFKKYLMSDDYIEFIKKYYIEISKELSKETLSTEKFTRIDYFLDVQLEEEIRKTLLKIYNKAPASLNRLEKKNRYKTSVYYNSKSKNINIYSRYEKIIDMMLKDNFKDVENVDIEKEIDPFVNEEIKNTLRFEVQLKRRKIKYYLKQDGTIADLFNYWNARDAEYFINDILKPLIYKGDYYNAYHAKKKLEEVYNEKLTNKLIEFQNYLSKFGFTKAKESYKNYHQLIKYLTDININPYLIPNNAGFKYIKNPIQFLEKVIDAYKAKEEVLTDKQTEVI